jgi:hypothetical protein
MNTNGATMGSAIDYISRGLKYELGSKVPPSVNTARNLPGVNFLQGDNLDFDLEHGHKFP